MDVDSRLAVVESKVEQIKEDLHIHMDDHKIDQAAMLKLIADNHTALMEEIAPIKADWQKYKGAAGMAILIGSMVWAGILFFKDSILAWLSK